MSSHLLVLLTFIIFPKMAFGNNKSPVKASPNTSAMVIHLKAPKGCREKQAVAWISQGRVLLYQADVSPEGSFEVHTNPGDYNVVVTGESGCYGEKIVTLAKSEVKDFTVLLTSPKNRLPAKENRTR